MKKKIENVLRKLVFSLRKSKNMVYFVTFLSKFQAEL